MVSRRSSVAVLAALVCLSSCGMAAQVPAAAPPATPSAEEMLRAFQTPPNSARPRVWWHWMNGNIAEDGIKLDLDWMHSAGIGGVTIFEGAISTPQVVPKRLIFMTPE